MLTKLYFKDWNKYFRNFTTRGHKDLHSILRWRRDISSCGTTSGWLHAPREINYLIHVHVLSSHIYTVLLYQVVSICIFASFVCINRRLLLPIPSIRCYNHWWPKNKNNFTYLTIGLEKRFCLYFYLKSFRLESCDTTIYRWIQLRWWCIVPFIYISRIMKWIDSAMINSFVIFKN